MHNNISMKLLDIDYDESVNMIITFIQNKILKTYKKRGVVLGISGGIDSSVTAALCVKSLGKEKVLGLLMPEKESSEETMRLSKLMINFLDIEYQIEDITKTLESLNCYKNRMLAIKKIIPEFDETWKFKIVLPSILKSDKYRVFSIIAKSPSNEIIKKRLDYKTYLEILSATNYKQRVRKMIEYYYADRFNYAVVGTPNRLEYDQGFFVKNGDGSADIKPIAHLYKTQVYQLANYFDIPHEIISNPPTTDTYSMPQSQEEFFFSVPYQIMDICLFSYNNDISSKEVSNIVNLTESQIENIFRDIKNKRRSSKYLHDPPQLAMDIRKDIQN